MPETEPPAEERPADESPGSPIRSLFAVIAGGLVVWMLGPLYMGVLVRLAADHFAGDRPTDVGLALLLAGWLPNGVLGGLLTGRLAGVAPIVHAAVLGSLFGFVAMMSMDQARGLPWWFALGLVLAPAVSVVLGGVVARITEKSRPRSRPTAAA